MNFLPVNNERDERVAALARRIGAAISSRLNNRTLDRALIGCAARRIARGLGMSLPSMLDWLTRAEPRSFGLTGYGPFEMVEWFYTNNPGTSGWLDVERAIGATPRQVLALYENAISRPEVNRSTACAEAWQ